MAGLPRFKFAGIHLYTILHKNTVKCSRSGLEPGPLHLSGVDRNNRMGPQRAFHFAAQHKLIWDSETLWYKNRASVVERNTENDTSARKAPVNLKSDQKFLRSTLLPPLGMLVV